MNKSLFVKGVEVDAGLILICDKSHYEKYGFKFDESLSQEFDIPNGEYKTNWHIEDTWNGDVSGSGTLKVITGKIIVSDPCYCAEDWNTWLTDHGWGNGVGADIEPDGGLLLNKMGGDGCYDVEIDLESV